MLKINKINENLCILLEDSKKKLFIKCIHTMVKFICVGKRKKMELWSKAVKRICNCKPSCSWVRTFTRQLAFYSTKTLFHSSTLKFKRRLSKKNGKARKTMTIAFLPRYSRFQNCLWIWNQTRMATSETFIVRQLILSL